MPFRDEGMWLLWWLYKIISCRWVLCANHMEPVKGFLGRFLRRRLLEVEVQEGVRSNDLNRIFDWIPKVWQHLNKFLETHSSSDVTIGENWTIYRMHLPHRSLSHLLTPLFVVKHLVLTNFYKELNVHEPKIIFSLQIACIFLLSIPHLM